ncbi:hypothetical protein GCM10017687_67640 [Streptomyces echinatus]
MSRAGRLTSHRTDGSATTSRREPRLADAAEIAAEQGLTPARISGLYNDRTANGFPEIAGMRGRARLWDHAQVTEWFATVRRHDSAGTHRPPVTRRTC